MIVDPELKKTVEALLFSSGKKLELEELSRLCKSQPEHVENALRLIRQELEQAQSSTMLVQDGTAWRLVVRERYLPVVRKIVRKTELPKGHLETLAVVAHKAPVLQSKIVKLRTNKAYDHLRLLEQNGFITREKHGRTRLLKLAQKFFDYFDLSPETLQAKFQKVQEVEQAIEVKEKEIEDSQAQVVMAAKAPEKEPEKQELETYPAIAPVEAKEIEETQPVEILRERLGELEVYGEEKPPKEKKKHRRVKKREEKPVEEKKEEEELEEAEEIKEEEKEVEEEKGEVEEKEEKIEEEEKAEEEIEGKEGVEEKAEEEVEEKEAIEEKEKAERVEEERAEEKKVKEKREKKKPEVEEEPVFKGKGLFPKGPSPEIEARIEQRVKEIIGEKPEEKEEEKAEEE